MRYSELMFIYTYIYIRPDIVDLLKITVIIKIPVNRRNNTVKLIGENVSTEERSVSH